MDARFVTDANKWTPDWVVELPDFATVAVPDDAKDEFHHHLFVFMRNEFNHGYSGRTIAVHGVGRVNEWKLNTSDGRERPRLWVASREGTLALFLAGQGEPQDDDIETWRRGVETALSSHGARQQVSWTAILSQRQTFPLAPSGDKLSSAEAAGGLTFRLLDGCIAEDVPVNMRGVGIMITERFHWPIRVDGSTSCYSWNEDGEWRTAQRLRTLSALLSVAWESCWTLREGPRDPAVEFAGTTGPLIGTSSRTIPEDSPLATGRPVTIPAWLERAELAVSDDAKLLESALLMHHEGVLLGRDHSSLSLVCFVAAIETIAQISKRPERCRECKSVLSSAQRFRDAIKTVLDENETEALAEAYSKRSKTVHQGTLYGAEIRMNSMGAMSLFLSDPILGFTMGTVTTAQRASRALILAKLGVESPEYGQSD